MSEHTLGAVSSVNLRKSRGKEGRSISDDITFSCSFCGCDCKLGDTTQSLAKLKYCMKDDCSEVHLCDKCMDVLCDITRYGPRVVKGGHAWERRSRVMRLSFIDKDLFCFSCFGTSKFHLYFKYDDLEAPNIHYTNKRVCAKCIICFLELMKNNDKLGDYKFPVYSGEAHVW